MSIWKAVKGVFGGDVAEKAVDAAIKTGDALFFTDEEKSVANMKMLELKIDWAKATTGSRLARRVLAFMFAGTFLFLVLLGVFLQLVGNTADSQFVFATAKDTLGTPVAVILGFYFATQLLRKS